MGERKLRYVDGNMIEYEIYDLISDKDPILHQPCAEYDFSNLPINPSFLSLSLSETLGAKGGIGLAAPQCGIPYRVVSIALVEGNNGEKSWDVITLFNPIIVDRSEKMVTENEGCLSFPDLMIEKERHDEIEVEYQNTKGQKIRGRFVGIDARCLQHEIDHLDGICFTDGLSPLKLQMAKKKAEKRNAKIDKLKKATLKRLLSQIKQ